MELSGERTLGEWTPNRNVPEGFSVLEVVIGSSTSGAGLEVVVLTALASASISREALGAYHAARVGKHTTPVVVTVVKDDQAWLFGPNAKAEVLGPLSLNQAERMLQAALDEGSGLAARRRLADLFDAARDTPTANAAGALPGVANSGLFATHEIRHGARLRPDWSRCVEDAGPLLSRRRQELIEALGFTPHREAAHALLLADGATSRAVAVLLDDAEHFDSTSSRFHVSPVAYAIALAQRHELSWVLIVRGSQLRLYPAKSELGVGRKGLAETYFELDLALVDDDTAGYLPLVFSAGALAPGGSTYEILEASAQYAVALGERLRAQVYEQIVPRLSLAVAEQLRGLGHQIDREGLDLAYQLTLRIFFRLLFQAYAEDRKLLPYGENPRYDRNALNTYARDLVEDPNQSFDSNSASIWDDLSQVWHVIDKGDSAWSVPAYNGGLFSADPELHPEGALLERMSITNDVMGPVLRAMLLDEAEGLIGPIDFRSLSVREFGTIYEGLLESNLAVADADLILDDKDTWVPAAADSYPLDPDRSAPAGVVYFHNTSGQRKGTGSYFTPSFVVEHLLERALDPTLAEHLARVKALLDAGDQAGAADLFFDFRVADLAMGSGHFLTAAIDHLEAGMAAFLEENPIPGVTNELRRLDEAAREAAGPDVPEPEPSSLLRRQIARRCIYGLDINPVAVELARVSIWIHTFVRGLPMSSLDHNLVCANSLTGIGTVDEALDALVPGRKGAPTLFDQPIEDALVAAREVLVDAGMLAEVDRKETQAASRAVLAAKDAAREASLLFDAAVLARTGHEGMTAATDTAALVEMASRPHAQEQVRSLQPAHLPALFPEVLLRPNAGFDVLIGNPPWEEVMVEEPKFWLRIAPGLLGLNARDMKQRIADLRVERADLLPELAAEVAAAATMRTTLLAGPFPGLGRGDIDLYRVFAWRNWQLLRRGGQLGCVFPRSLLNAAGAGEWRSTVLSGGGIGVTTLVNTGGWVFPSIDGRYAIALVTIESGASADAVELSGPFHDRAALENAGTGGRLAVAQLRSAAEGSAFPHLPDAASIDVFAAIRRAPRLDTRLQDWDFRPATDFHATNDRPTFDAGGEAPGRWPVLGGSAFNLWDPDFGAPYAWADPTAVVGALFTKRLRQAKLKSSAFFGSPAAVVDDKNTLPCMSPRIAFRDITNATNRRTVIAALIPGERVLVNPAPYLLRVTGDARDEAFLLGCLSSIPLDWYARRYVELHVNFHILNGLPIPLAGRKTPQGARVAEIAGVLAACDNRFAEWARAVGVPVGSVATSGVTPDLEAELDALVASLYGLTRDQLEHVFATFHRGWDYQPRLDAVLRHFDATPSLA
jgi:hypothetical protein